MVRRPPLGFVQVVVLPVKTRESDIGVKTVDGRSGGGAASFPRLLETQQVHPSTRPRPKKAVKL